MFGAEAAAILEQDVTKRGLKLYKRNDIDKVNGGEGVTLSLDPGRQVTFELLIVGRGVQPNTPLAIAAGLRVNEEVCIDRFCRRSRLLPERAGLSTMPGPTSIGLFRKQR